MDVGAQQCLSVRNSTSKTLNAVRLTWQATQKNKFGFYIDYTKNCSGRRVQDRRRSVPESR